MQLPSGFTIDLYVIDLARITSKWIGEAEKNLVRAFDAAEAGHVMLLFDEADTVLGKRTANVKGVNDRNAHLSRASSSSRASPCSRQTWRRRSIQRSRGACPHRSRSRSPIASDSHHLERGA